MSNATILLKKIKEKKAKIAVIGLGYVGLPLAILFAKKGFVVEGYTKTKKNIISLNNGKSNVSGIEKNLKKVLRSKKFSAHSVDDKILQKNDIYIICVPTPIDKQKNPDLSILKQVAKRLSVINLKNKLIINESTVAPFTTRKILGTLANEYFLTCSPERINPGSTRTVENIPKVIGGINESSLALAVALYEQVLKKELVKVSSMEIAEMSKMLENTYRAINIALVNEFAKLAEVIEIDILEVINAAKTKWSFQAHFPGIGVGGHCIPVDPYYIVKLAKDKGVEMKTITSGLASNEIMPLHIAQKIMKYYKPGLKVLLYGLTYKKNVVDLRESPVLILCEALKQKKINFNVYDPFIDAKKIEQLGYTAGKLEKVDIFVVGTDHKQLAYDYELTVDKKTIVIDGRNFFLTKVGRKTLGVGRVKE